MFEDEISSEFGPVHLAYKEYRIAGGKKDLERFSEFCISLIKKNVKVKTGKQVAELEQRRKKSAEAIKPIDENYNHTALVSKSSENVKR